LGGSNNGGGTYSSTPAGLSINSSNGTISPSSSSVGNYTITYIVPASGGCSQVVATTNVEIEAEPDATFSYGTTDFCAVGADPTPSRNQVGGVFSSTPAGLVINTSTGQIDLDASTVGSYTVYYTFAAANGCGQVQESQNITITPDLGDALLDGFAYDQTTPPEPGPISSQILACHQGDGILTLHIDPALIPYIVRWEYNNGSGFQMLPDDGDPDSNVLTRHFTGLIGTTSYRVVFSTGTACGNAGYSSVAYVSVIPPDLKPEPVQAAPTEFCFGGASTMTASVNYGADQLNSGGLFQTGQINTQDPNGWLVDGAVRGLSAAGNNLKNNNWSGTNPHPLTVAGITATWDSGMPKYAIAGGVLNQNQQNDPYYYEGGVAMTTLTTPIFSLMTIQDATFTFDEAFILSGPLSCNSTSYPAGQAARLPHRAGRDRGGPATPAVREGGRGPVPRGPAGRQPARGVHRVGDRYCDRYCAGPRRAARRAVRGSAGVHAAVGVRVAGRAAADRERQGRQGGPARTGTARSARAAGGRRRAAHRHRAARGRDLGRGAGPGGGRAARPRRRCAPATK
jgi:hypothetical protein